MNLTSKEKELDDKTKEYLEKEEKGELGCFLADVREYAILVELYKVAGAELIWNTKDKQFIDVLVEETIELRKLPKDKQREKNEKLSKKVNEVLSEHKEIEVIDPISGTKKKLDLSSMLNLNNNANSEETNDSSIKQ